MKLFDLIIANAKVATTLNETYHFVIIDVGIKNGKITSLDQGLNAKDSTKYVNAEGFWLLPGIIDTQVHFREPGLTHKEDIESGSRGAIKGGITSFFEMPNTKPATDSVAALSEKVEIAKVKSWSDFAFYGGATAENIMSLAAIENTDGCCGIKVFMGSSTGTLLLDNPAHLEQVLKNTTKRIALHCEDEQRLNERKHLAAEAKNPIAHPLWRDEETAYRATERVLSLAKKLDRKVHILHVSTAQEIELLKQFTEFASFEILPQHLTLHAPDCYERLGTLAQMNPPIRSRFHQEALWRAVRLKQVSVLGSDHAPHTLEEKSKEYPLSPSGMPGTQTLFLLMVKHFNEGKIKFEHILELLCMNPAKLFGIQDKGHIRIGFDADLVLFNPSKTWTIENSWIESKSKWTPFNGTEITGFVSEVFLRGQQVVANGELLEKPNAQPLKFTLPDND